MICMRCMHEMSRVSNLTRADISHRKLNHRKAFCCWNSCPLRSIGSLRQALDQKLRMKLCNEERPESEAKCHTPFTLAFCCVHLLCNNLLCCANYPHSKCSYGSSDTSQVVKALEQCCCPRSRQALSYSNRIISAWGAHKLLILQDTRLQNETDGGCAHASFPWSLNDDEGKCSEGNHETTTAVKPIIMSNVEIRKVVNGLSKAVAWTENGKLSKFNDCLGSLFCTKPKVPQGRMHESLDRAATTTGHRPVAHVKGFGVIWISKLRWSC